MQARREKGGGYYSLHCIKKLVRNGAIDVTRKALDCANRDFGWDYPAIRDALCGLKDRHFYKSERHRVIPGVVVDIYKARKLKGEDVYLHFYVDYLDGEERVILNSFKHLEG